MNSDISTKHNVMRSSSTQPTLNGFLTMESPNRSSPASDQSPHPSGLAGLVNVTVNRGNSFREPNLNHTAVQDNVQTAGGLDAGRDRAHERQFNEVPAIARTFSGHLHPPENPRSHHHRYGSRHVGLGGNYCADERHSWPRRLFSDMPDWESDKEKMRDGYHRFRDTRIPRTVSQLASSTGVGARWLLPKRATQKERDTQREPSEGVLKPIPIRNSQSSSRPSTRQSSESRRDSFLDDYDVNAQLGQMKRNEIKTKEDLERERRKRKNAEESLRYTLGSIATLATEITRKLDYTYYNLLEQISKLHVTINTFQELANSSAKLLTTFQDEKDRITREYRGQFEEFQGFKLQLQKVDRLEKRLTASKQQASALNARLDAVREEIHGWNRREVEWQARVSRRLRILWAILGSLIVVVILATVIQNLPSSSTSILVENILSLTNSSRRTSTARTSYQDVPLASFDIKAPLRTDVNQSDDIDPLWSFLREVNTCAQLSVPTTSSTPAVSLSRTDNRIAEDQREDPLAVFDEL